MWNRHPHPGRPYRLADLFCNGLLQIGVEGYSSGLKAPVMLKAANQAAPKTVRREAPSECAADAPDDISGIAD